MGALAKQLGKQSQVKVFAAGGAVCCEAEAKKPSNKMPKGKKLLKKGGKCK